MTKREALKMALEALKKSKQHIWLGDEKGIAANIQCTQTITVVEKALAQPEPFSWAGDPSVQDYASTQPEQEPVAWISPKELLVMRGNAYAGAKNWRVNLGLEPEEGDVGLYTTPPQRTWVGLTDEEIDALSREMVKGNKSVNWLCRAIEAAHNIKGEA